MQENSAKFFNLLKEEFRLKVFVTATKVSKKGFRGSNAYFTLR